MGRIVVLLAIIFSSCVTQKKCEQKFPTQEITNIRDSVAIRDSVNIRDSINIVSKDSIVIKEGISGKDSIPCTENAKTTIKRGGDVFNVWVKNGKVYFDYNLEGTTSRFNTTIQVLKQEIALLKESKSSNVETKTEVVTKTETYIPWWVKVLAWIGAGALVWTLVKLLIQKLADV
jgi:hypothetical protein